MQEPTNHQKPIQVIPILREALDLYRDNYILFFQIVLVGYAVGLIQQILSVFKISFGWFEFILSLGGFLLTVWASVAITFAIFKRYANQEIDIKTAFATTWKKIWRYFWVSTVGFLISIVGLLLLFIPGIYLGTIFMLVGTVLVLEDAAFFDCFKRSKSLIQGHFGPVLLINFCLFILGLAIFFIWKLDISVTLKGFMVYLINLFYWPFSVAVVVNVYNRLKEGKETIVPSEGETVQKGVGCLGCLTASGLFIVMIALSLVWFNNISLFLKSEKGGRVYEWVAKQFSPQLMELSDGLTFQRPEGYFVYETRLHNEPKTPFYMLYGFLEKKMFTVTIHSFSKEDLGIEDTRLSQFDRGKIWNRYYSYLLSQSPNSEVKLNDMEVKSEKTLNIAGKSWGQYKLKEKEGKYAKPQKVAVYNFTLQDNEIICVTYGYKIGVGEQEPNYYQAEVQRIISGFNF